MSISEEQFGFVKGKSITDASFALRKLHERYREGPQALHCVFIDLEAVNDCIGACEKRGCQRGTSDW